MCKRDFCTKSQIYHPYADKFIHMPDFPQAVDNVDNRGTSWRISEFCPDLSGGEMCMRTSLPQPVWPTKVRKTKNATRR